MGLTLWLSSLRYLLHHPWQMGLSILGVALGVAVVVSIDLANQSAKRAFTLSTDVVAGKATHHIVGGPGGLDENAYRLLRVERGIRVLAPVVEGFAVSPDFPEQTFQILGIDPFAEAPFRSYLSGDANADINALITRPDTILIAEETANTLGLVIGDILRLSIGGFRHDVQIVGLIQPSDEVSRQAISSIMVTDIATAQELLGISGTLSRIDVAVTPDATGQQLISEIQSALPSGAEIIEASARSESVNQLTRAFDLNLTALSLLALIVGTFLIYNTMTFSVVQRRPLIGTLRALGVTRGQVFTLILGETLLIGFISSFIGVLLGIILGRGLVQIVTTTINDLFFVVTVRELAVQPEVLIKGALLGIVATAIASLVPAIEATSVSTRSALSRSTIESSLRRAIPPATLVGVVVLAIGIGLLIFPSKSIFLSFGGLFGLVLGLSMLIPAATILLMRILAPLAGKPFGLMGAMAARGVSASLSRTAVAIAALAVAVSITVGIGTMVQSFRGTVERWLDTSLQADIYVSPPSLLSNRVQATLAPEVLQSLMATENIVNTSTFRGTQIDSPQGTTHLVVLDTQFELFNRHDRFKEGNPSQIWDAFQNNDIAIISEPYAYHHDLAVGSTVSMLTDEGEREFSVEGVYYDYSSSQGVVMVSRNTYKKYWNDDGVSSLGIYATQEANLNELVASLYQSAGDTQELSIRSNRDLREASLEVFDRSFAITSVMRVLAMIVAFIGVLSALMALQLERSRELGVLRAIGFTPRQIWGLVTSQTGLMGLVAGLLSLPMGLILATGLIFVVNRRSFGWSMDMQIIPSILLEALALAIVAALIAGIYPAIKMAKSSAAEALREE